MGAMWMPSKEHCRPEQGCREGSGSKITRSFRPVACVGRDRVALWGPCPAWLLIPSGVSHGKRHPWVASGGGAGLGIRSHVTKQSPVNRHHRWEWEEVQWTSP
jgi:hypothetical protein